MPNPSLGYSFAPTFENAQLSRANGAASQPNDALQVLSYRLPRVLNASALSPLLGDTLKGGPNMAVLQSVMKTILGEDLANAILNGSASPSSFGSSPPPVIHPGSNPPQEFPTEGGFSQLPPPSQRLPRDFPPYDGGTPEFGSVPGRTEVPGPEPMPYNGPLWPELPNGRASLPDARSWLRSSGSGVDRNPFATGSMY